MKIIFLSWWFPYPPNNGSRIRNFNLLKQLSQRHDIILLSFYQEERERDWITAMQPYCREVHVVQAWPFRRGSLKSLAGILSTKPRSLQSMYNPAMHKLVSDMAARHRPDLVIASEIGVADKTSIYTVGLDIPKVLEDLELSVIKERSARQPGKIAQFRHALTWRKMVRYTTNLLRHFDGCTVASDQEHDNLRELLAGKGCRTAVIPNGVDLELYTAEFGQPEPDTLIFTGALSYYANFAGMEFFLNQIYPLIRANRPQVSLRITGKTEGIELERLPLHEGVNFTGYLDDIRPAIGQSWACIVPLLDGGGTRLKVLEAMALGTPVIATSKGAEGLEAVPGQDLLVADDPADFAGQVLRLLNDGHLRRQLSENGQKLVRTRYNWGMIGRNLDEFLETLVKARNDGSKM